MTATGHGPTPPVRLDGPLFLSADIAVIACPSQWANRVIRCGAKSREAFRRLRRTTLWHLDAGSGRLSNRLPFACEFLRLGNLRGGHVPCGSVSIFYCILVALRSRQAEPHVGADKVLLHAMTEGVSDPEAQLSKGETLIGSPPKPRRPLSIILRHALAVRVCNPEIELGISVALVRSETRPLYRLGVVLQDPMAKGIHHPEFVLCRATLGRPQGGKTSEPRRSSPPRRCPPHT